jgi:S-adenosylmethionine:diacylglycerol 3-amino-3-carboxypropyl transferase
MLFLIKPHSCSPPPADAARSGGFLLLYSMASHTTNLGRAAIGLAALKLKSHHNPIAIASGGCNLLNDLAADPARVIE